MRAQEKMELRNVAFIRLREIDSQLVDAFDEVPTIRAASAARSLLDERAKYADRIVALGGQPGAVPVQDRSQAC